MNKITFVTGASATGKGTRMKRVVEYLTSKCEPEIYIRDLHERLRPENILTREIGRLFPSEGIFVFGFYGKDGATWHSLDHRCTLDLSGLFKEMEDKGIDVICDINSTLVNHPTIPLITLESPNVEAIYFYHEDLDEALSRINPRRAKRGRSQWSMEDYRDSTAYFANGKAKRLHERNDFSSKILIDARVSEEWLVNHLF